MTDLYGIKNCDTVKKARKWLDAAGVSYQFHDLKAELKPEDLDRWLAVVGWEVLVNKRSTTWRQLPEATKTQMDAALARETLLTHVTLIKRPVLVTGEQVHVGFKAEQYQSLFS